MLSKNIDRYKNFDQIYRLKSKNLILLDYKNIMTKIYKLENIKKNLKLKNQNYILVMKIKN